MSSQVSVAYSQPTPTTATVSISVVPNNEDGSPNFVGMNTFNIGSSPVDGSPEAALLTSMEDAISTFLTSKGVIL